MRIWATALLATALLPASLGRAMSPTPDSTRFSEREKVDLKDLLIAGLKVRTPGEKAFISKVVKAVDEGQLSDALVKAVFQRARKQHGRYPLPYFVVMIRQVAKERGVAL